MIVMNKIISLLLFGLLAVPCGYAQKNISSVSRIISKGGKNASQSSLRASAGLLSAKQTQDLQRKAGKSWLKHHQNRFKQQGQVKVFQTDFNTPTKAYLSQRADAATKAKNDALLADIKRVLDSEPTIATNSLFQSLYQPMTIPSEFAVKNNQLLLQATKHFIEKVNWLKNRPGQGQPELGVVGGKDVAAKLAERLSSQKMIILGEMHYVDSIHSAVGDFLHELKRLNPKRRIVLFTEFIDLPALAAPEGTTTASYYRRVSKEKLGKLAEQDPQLVVDYAKPLFDSLIQGGIEVYPLEDRALYQMISKEQGPLFKAEASLRGIMLRNQSWVRVMESKIRQIRKTDPDTLFVVYAGLGHTSWVYPYSLPKFFANENPAVVALSYVFPIGDEVLSGVWKESFSFYDMRFHFPTIHYWRGPDARELAKQTGFDYAWVLPWAK